jgi:nucleoside-diphosphate-sugar epimerase
VRVFVAGGSGAIGGPLVEQLVAAGHQTTAMTRREDRVEKIRRVGARPVVCDAFDRPALEAALKEAAPDVVINQLTSLPREYNPRSIDYGPTNRLRSEAGANLIAAARAAGARRFLTQSIAFLYAPQGDWVKDEEARPFDDAPAPFGEGVGVMLEHEEAALEAEGMQGVVLRYGQFYGPGTYYAADGDIARRVKKRRFPVVRPGTGMFSFIHVDDAAGATVAALEHGPPGVYNVVDDEPAPLHEWLPVYAEFLGAKSPRTVPRWLARLAAGRAGVAFATELRGASNEKAKRGLEWKLRFPSWREGFRAGLG